ncbi:mannose-1-phosphate guanylyltransferase [Odoribacter lunatus]|uniref:mannose-1-phosphate guanylyltransferase n=1 Tax=Odoribacter lunatus TaxID=2941335 RepID=UPI00203F2A9E|nr:mannose-1-phosphate guanylyltransferase [Odoribacter lunatus]
MIENNHLVIMAGGIGSRFWPVSTPEKPKQFIDILGIGRSLLQLTVKRFEDVCSSENVWVVTSVNYKNIVREQLPEVPETNILTEPCMRNTAPCIAYAAWKIKKRNSAANIIVSPADHIVTDVEEFRRVMKKGLLFTAGENRILTVGMRPHRPETGYGYIKVRESAEVGEIREVDGFKEKPDRQKAEEYLNVGGYLWNSGIFVWNVATIEKVFRQKQPDMARIFDELEGYFYTLEEQDAVNRWFPECENISIDYAIMEHAHNIYVFPADFGWSDLGTWGSLHELSEKDSDKNAVVGKGVRLVECRDCVVRVSADKRMVVQGLDGYIVAEHKGVLLVCNMKDEQRIKEFSKMLNT